MRKLGPVSKRTQSLVCAAPLAFLLVFPGCGGEDLSGSTFVTMADNNFSPEVIHVPAGGHVHFRNWGGIVHNAISIDGSWSTEDVTKRVEMRVGEWVDVKFDEPGVYQYYCSFHGTADGSSGMVGTVVVGDVEYTPEMADAGKIEPVEEATGVTRRVPQDFPDVQTAVDAADPGDLVLISDGVYYEEVQVTTPSLTIRGTDRNAVVLDGQYQQSNGITVFANGVAIENLTARNYTLNGLFWTGVTGYRGSYVTVINNGDYGIYTFESYDGVLDHSMATGSPDAGYYVGGCYPCRTILDQVIAEGNIGGGYSGTNSGGELYIINSIFRHNGGGVAPNTFDVEPNPPERETTIIGNLIHDNRGSGIRIVGGNDNVVMRNYISGHGREGIHVSATRDRNYYPSTGNIIRDNVILASGRSDIRMSGLGNLGNCFSGNLYRTTVPWGLEILQGCDGVRLPVVGDANAYLFGIIGRNNLFNPRREFSDEWKTMPHPDPQPQMPGGADAPVVPPLNPFDDYPLDLESIGLPAPPAQPTLAAAGRISE